MTKQDACKYCKPPKRHADCHVDCPDYIQPTDTYSDPERQTQRDLDRLERRRQRSGYYRRKGPY